MIVARAGSAFVLLGALATTQDGCFHPETCGARGSSTTVSGVVSYAIAAGAGSTVSETVTIDDLSDCTYDAEEFPIFVGACELWVSLEEGPEPPSRNFPGNPSAWAAIEAGQTCDLPLLGGTAAVTIDSGTVAFANSTTGVFLSGTLVRWTKGHGPTGALEWQFQGSGWPQ